MFVAKRETVWIGGREVPIVVAALIAEEADRLGLLPSQVGDVVIPVPAPSHVEISGLRLSIATAAALAEAADEKGVHPVRMVELVVREHAEDLNKRARTRETTRPLEGTWMLPSDSSKRRGGGGHES